MRIHFRRSIPFHASLVQVSMLSLVPLVFLKSLCRVCQSDSTTNARKFSNPLEEVHVGKLLHLLHILHLDHLFIVEQHPRGLLAELLADKGNVMPEACG